MEVDKIPMLPETIPIDKSLVGSFNPIEKYLSNWIIPPGRDETKEYLSCHHLDPMDPMDPIHWDNPP